MIFDIDNQLERTVEWVKYAETKNGILLTLLSALLFAFFQQDKIPITTKSGILFSVTLFIEIIILVYSFVPILDTVTKNKRWLKYKRKKYREKRRNGNMEAPKKWNPNSINLHYFGNMVHLSCEHFMYAIRVSYGNQNNKYFIDVCNRIKVNSDIAYRKFQIFRIVGYGCFVTFILLFVAA